MTKSQFTPGTSQGWIDKRGYHWIYVTENGKRRAKRKHRDIMEKYLNRKLSPEEAVHHIDGNPSNNDISNLELISFTDHQREHHINSKRPEQTRRTMQVLANYREENKHLKSVNADLLEALELLAERDFYIGNVNDGAARVLNGHIAHARAVIAKAKGE